MSRLEIRLLEFGTTEFETLTPDAQNLRTETLSNILHTLTDNPPIAENDKKQVIRLACELLEIHLTGKLEMIEITKDKPKKRRR